MTGQALSVKMSATRTRRRRTLLLMADELQERVGAAIRRRRHELRISPLDFAKAMHISIKTLERWERGETGGGIANIDKVATELKTSEAQLMAVPGDKSAGTPDLAKLNGMSADPAAQLAEALDLLRAMQTTLDAESAANAEMRSQIAALSKSSKQRASGAK